MTRIELNSKLDNLIVFDYVPDYIIEGISNLLNEVYKKHEKEIKDLEIARDYWKLSFDKQVEANR